MIQFNLESWTAEEIEGWAIDTLRPKAPVRLTLEISEITIYTFYTDMPRNDVAESLGLQCRPGFCLPIPFEILESCRLVSVFAHGCTGEKVKLGDIENTNLASREHNIELVSTAQSNNSCIALLEDGDDALGTAERLASYANISQVIVYGNSFKPEVACAELAENLAPGKGCKIHFVDDSILSIIERSCQLEHNILLFPTHVELTSLRLDLMCRIARGRSKSVGCAISPVNVSIVRIKASRQSIDEILPCIPSASDIVLLDFERIHPVVKRVIYMYGKESAYNHSLLCYLVREVIGSGQQILSSFNGASFTASPLTKANNNTRPFAPNSIANMPYRILDISMAYKRAVPKLMNKRSEGAILNTRMPRILYILGEIKGGGVGETTLDLISAIASDFQCYILSSSGGLLMLYAVTDEKELIAMRAVKLSDNILYTTHRSFEYECIFGRIIDNIDVDIVHSRTVLGHSLGIADICRSRQVPLVHSFHDFYFLCPSHNLLDENGVYCEGYCTSTSGLCRSELIPQKALPPLKNRFVHEWRKLLANYLRECDGLITTSKYAADKIQSFFPEAGDITIIEHGRNLVACSEYTSPIERHDENTLRIAAIGAHNKAKGGEELEKLLGFSEVDGSVEIDIYGNVDPRLGLLANKTKGYYERESISSILSSGNYDAGIILSRWPETYCHTLSEYWMASLPVIAYNLNGAISERMLKYPFGGWLVDIDSTIEEVWDFLVTLGRDKSDIISRKGAIAANITSMITPLDVMAEEYSKMYRECLSAVGPPHFRNLPSLLSDHMER